MQIIRNTLGRVAAIAMAVVMASLPLTRLSAQSDHNFETAKNLDIFNNLLKTVDLYYVDTIDAGKLVKTAADAMLETLDPYTNYFPESESNDLKQMLTGRYGGMGALIHFNKELHRCIIAEPFKGSPSAEAGLRAGDIIIAIDDKTFGPITDNDDTGKFTESVSSALRGEPGTTVRIKIERPGEKKQRVVAVKRAAIKSPAVTWYGMVGDKGYINLSQFTEGCAAEMHSAVEDLRQKGAKGLVIDLRGNGGGSLEEAVDIVNLFVGKGKTVVSLKGKVKASNQTLSTEHDALVPDMPIVVMVNGGSASSSEIMAGTLQDYDRAVIVGSRTYGKGLVQQTRPLPYNGVIKVTTSKYYIPSGRCIQAIDYSNRNADGSVGRIPDSLTHVFHTADGREVRDGGGILPDSIVSVDSVANIVIYLSPSMTTSQVLFDFVTDYIQRHPTVAQPTDFDISDEEYARFCTYAREHKFKYDQQSGKLLASLKKTAAFEGYDIKDEVAAIEAKLNHNEDYDFAHWKPEIKRLLNSEIMLRYYYREGAVRNALNGDKVFETAVGILDHPEVYSSILSPKNKQKTK